MQTEELGTTTGAKAEKLVVLLGGGGQQGFWMQHRLDQDHLAGLVRFHEYLDWC